MKLILLFLLFTIQHALFAYNTNDPYLIEKKVLTLSSSLHLEMMALSEYRNLKRFCNDDLYRQSIFTLLNQMHRYHDLLEQDLLANNYPHSKGTIKKILKHMENLDEKYHSEEFLNFFREQCSFASKIEKNSDHYRAGFSTHSYGAKVYAQEVVMYRYMKQLTKKVKNIKKHVEHFYIRRKVWEL